MLRLWVWFAMGKKKILGRLREGLDEEDGATVAEYALVLVLVSLAVITILTSLGATLEDKVQAIINKLTEIRP